MANLYPSLISADLLNLQRDISLLEPYCAGFHCDVMDFNFVPNLTLGPAVVNAIATATTKKIWVHLMIKDPDKMIERLMLPPESIVSFHIETEINIPDTIKHIQEKNWVPSLAINPKTPIAESYKFLEQRLPHILLMSVSPGFSGQKFIPETIAKINELVAYKNREKLEFNIGMDGGINASNIALLANHGVDDLAIASGIFGASDPVAQIQELNQLSG